MQMFQISQQQMRISLSGNFIFLAVRVIGRLNKQIIFPAIPLSFKWTKLIDFLILRKPHFEMVAAVTWWRHKFESW